MNYKIGMKHIVFNWILIGLLFCGTVARAQKRISRKEYIETYAPIAVAEMKRVGVPASITLAQGCLESDDSNSSLSVKSNNHFGIKCHKDWAGKKYYQDDDAKNECFRVYDSPEESYRDHSDFLKKGQRYSFLFQLDRTDYNAWAEGLKKAGYATNPKYPELLVKIIEDYKLYEYDGDNASKLITASAGDKKRQAKIAALKKGPLPAPPSLGDVDNFVVESPVREVHENNKRQYIIARGGDSFTAIAREYDLMLWQVYKFNDLTKDSSLQKGQIIYIQPKRGRAERKYKAHVVRSGESLYTISQLYGVKLKKLYKFNNFDTATAVKAGDVVFVRRP